jgi:hypothetical protein
MSDPPQGVQPTQGRPAAAVTEANAPPSTPLDSAAEIPRVMIPWGSAGLEIDRGATPADVKEIQARINRQWLDDTQLAGEAIARLESMIEESTRQARER